MHRGQEARLRGGSLARERRHLALCINNQVRQPFCFFTVGKVTGAGPAVLRGWGGGDNDVIPIVSKFVPAWRGISCKNGRVSPGKPFSKAASGHFMIIIIMEIFPPSLLLSEQHDGRVKYSFFWFFWFFLRSQLALCVCVQVQPGCTILPGFIAALNI